MAMCVTASSLAVQGEFQKRVCERELLVLKTEQVSSDLPFVP